MGIARSVLVTSGQNRVQDTGTAQFSAAEWNSALDEAGREIRVALMTAGYKDFWNKSGTITTLVTPTDCQEVLSIRNAETDADSPVFGRYRVKSAASDAVGATIEVLVGSGLGAAYTTTIRYIRTYTSMTQATDEPDIPDETHYLTVYGACARYWEKNGGQPEKAAVERGLFYDGIKAFIASRGLLSPKAQGGK